MKAETTSENRARFFALYWEQQVAKIRCFDHLIEVSNRIYKDEGYPVIDAAEYIALKPLSAISDEDAIEVAKLNQWQHQTGTHEIYLNHWGQKVIKTAEGSYGYFVIIEPKLNPSQVDFLRSRGYALSWMGLSVEEVIAAGWVKLTDQ